MDGKWEFGPESDFGEILDRIEHGETVEVTRGGRVIARIMPVDAQETGKADPPSIDELRAFRKKFTLGPGLTMRDLIDEGRR